MRIRKKKWARPELAACPFYVHEPKTAAGTWGERFKKQQPIHLDLGCGKCTRECPRGVLHVHERIFPIVVACSNEAPGKDARKQCEVSCIGCGLCAKACPSGAASVVNNLSRIDETLCLSCGQCLVKCPRGAIRDVRGILRK